MPQCYSSLIAAPASDSHPSSPQVDSNFNIYEVSLPWAIQRALSPCTAGGAQSLRTSLLTPDNKLQWERCATALAILGQQAVVGEVRLQQPNCAAHGCAQPPWARLVPRRRSSHAAGRAPLPTLR